MTAAAAVMYPLALASTLVSNGYDMEPVLLD